MTPSRQHTQSAPLPHPVNSDKQHDAVPDANMYSPSPASPPSTHSTRLSSPHMSHVSSLSPSTAQFPPSQMSAPATTQHSQASHASPIQSDSNPHFQHQSFQSPLQARPQFRSPSSDHRPQFRPSQFDEQSFSRSSQSQSPPVDAQSASRSPLMDVDLPEARSPKTDAGPSQQMQYRSARDLDHPSQPPPAGVHATQVTPGMFVLFVVHEASYENPITEEARSSQRPVFKTSRMVTLLITDYRNRAEDHQLAEVVVPLRPVDPESPEAGYWANAEDIVDRLQSSPSRIELPGKVYTMRGKWKQFFLRVIDGRSEVSASANLLISPERTLDVGIVRLLPSELPPAQGGHGDAGSRQSTNSRQGERHYAETSRKRQRSPSEGGRERRPFSMSS
ncbi:hypothetical protein K435DRAFT_350764 [Dendrothele bispora CBS 962.96]|uniref:Uncharacterized protein n=1 Tax=Dendrothele bispora (strain CBS 962.96) TaxID=1314807 RepID=A0A4S8MI21_DENBC|nr:hypothetical protein K435DRAFT_350764 [Dendrothele bispora CBS 962.96]